jgi:hypothetical protein
MDVKTLEKLEVEFKGFERLDNKGRKNHYRSWSRKVHKILEK